MWESWRGLTYSLRGTEMKFRPMVEADRVRAQGTSENDKVPKMGEDGNEDEDEEKKPDGMMEEEEEGGSSGEGDGEVNRNIEPRKSKKKKKQ